MRVRPGSTRGRGRALLVAACLVAGGLAGCGGGAGANGTILIDLELAGDVTLAERNAIRRLDLGVQGAESFQSTVPVSTEFTSGGALLRYHPGATSGRLAFRAEVDDQQGAFIAAGTGDVAIDPAAEAMLTIVLDVHPPPLFDLGASDGNARDGSGAASDLADLAGGPDSGVPDSAAPDLACAMACNCVPCSLPHAQSTCENDACAVTSCNAGYADCNGNPMDGCEASVASDAKNCGRCGNACGVGMACRGGQCVSCPFAPRAEYAVAANPAFIAIGDLNGDGKRDLVTASGGAAVVSVLYNQGGGTFGAHMDYSTGAGPHWIALADYDGDGRLDIATANSAASTVSILLNRGNGQFAAKSDYAAGQGSSSVAAGDLSGDGRTDLVTSNVIASTATVLINGGGSFNQKFDYALNTTPTSVAVGDINGNGRLDVASTGSDKVSVLLNAGAGTLTAKTDFATATAPGFVAVADLDADGRNDLVTTSTSMGGGTVGVFLNSGNNGLLFPSRVDYPAGGTTSSLAIADLDRDGHPDLVTANYSASTVSVFINGGNGVFQAHADYPVGTNPGAVAAADLDGDGVPDVATANYTGSDVTVLISNGCKFP